MNVKSNDMTLQEKKIEKLEELANHLEHCFSSPELYTNKKWQKLKSELASIDKEIVEQGEQRMSAEDWIRFEDKLPLDGQEILLVWPSGNYHPEYRKVTNEMLKGDYSLLRWIPIPNYPPINQ